MRKTSCSIRKAIAVCCALLLCLVPVSGCSGTGEQSPDLSYIDDIEQFCLEQDISVAEDGGIQYVPLDAHRVFVLDQRNSDEFLYVHSEIKASVDQNGTLIVRVTDTTAASESNISGSYAVLITSKQEISKIEIEQEDKTGTF